MVRKRAFSAMKSIMLISLVLCVCNHPAALSQSLPRADDCLNQTCGNLTLSYPFKLQSQPHCPSFSSFFELECNQGILYLHNFTHNDLDVPMRVLHIQSDSLVIDATALIATMKPLQNGTCSTGDLTSLVLPTFPGPFIFADDNIFGSFGCTMGVVVGAEVLRNTSTSEPFLSDVELGGCSVLCPGNEMNPECGGHTCCVSNLAHGTSFRGVIYIIDPSPFITNSSEEFNLAPCNSNYVTLFDPNYTNFSNQSYGLKITWALPLNQTNSTKDIQNSSNFACSNYSNITIVQEVPGYRCSCQHGFDGDGYSLGFGCSDVDECANASLNDCIPGKSTCHNNVKGSYTCKCNSRYHVGDGMRNGSGCKFSPVVRNAFAIVGAIVFLGLLIAGIVCFATYWRRKIKKKYFLLNGGVQLQHIISKARGNQEASNRLFTAEELKAATENYAEHMKLGMGGFGTVYKGVLPDGRLVAIKKANKAGHGGNEQFLNEMQILMQINHRNIVRLLGCCMETAVPLLVYEFVAHGNVRENLDLGDPGFMNWAQRLKVARQTAEALAYLHAAASPPILHRDVKSANILLDDNLDAKVADFGASRLVPAGVQHVSTAVQGTIGYLDPEYFQTLQLTDKSDVYSLGVMLVELITGLKPIDNQSREPGFANLALLFINRMQEARGEELIDSRLEDLSTLGWEKSWDLAMVRSSIMAVAGLARRCLALRGVDRPSMSLLADELRHITRSLEDFNNELDADENSPLMPSKPKLSEFHEAGAVLKQNADVFVQSASSIMSINDMHLDMPTLPR